MIFQQKDQESKEGVRIWGLGDVPIATEKMWVYLMKRMKEINQLTRIIEAIRDKEQEEKKDEKRQQG